MLGLIITAIGGGLHGLTFSLMGAALGFGVLWLVGWLGSIILKQDAMGGGDIKMMGMVGIFVGWTGVLLTIFLGALIGTIIFLPLSLMGRKKLVPFGVFLATRRRCRVPLRPEDRAVVCRHLPERLMRASLCLLLVATVACRGEPRETDADRNLAHLVDSLMPAVEQSVGHQVQAPPRGRPPYPR